MTTAIRKGAGRRIVLGLHSSKQAERDLIGGGGSPNKVQYAGLLLHLYSRIFQEQNGRGQKQSNEIALTLYTGLSLYLLLLLHLMPPATPDAAAAHASSFYGVLVTMQRRTVCEYTCALVMNVYESKGFG